MHQNVKLANRIIETLKSHNINAYVWHISSHNSVYIRFNDSRMCTIRIADHKEIKKYPTKWNIRHNYPVNKQPWVKSDKGTWRYFTHPNNWNKLIPILINRFNQIQTWKPKHKYVYGIPKFKK